MLLYMVLQILDDISRWSSEYANIEYVNQKIDFTLNY